MRCQKKPGLPSKAHKFVLVAGVTAAAWFAQSAVAGCPPGYLSKAGHCIPGPAQPHHPPVIESTQHAPVAVSPVDASKLHALNPQPVPLDKAALNPQPIPPGHLLPKSSSPPPHVPVDPTPHWDLKKNKGS
ncbi:MAG TPA: hypothetical protein VGM84_04315 [Steroidobacteraceae bacterium]|jgi:hypothetical protein